MISECGWNFWGGVTLGGSHRVLTRSHLIYSTARVPTVIVAVNYAKVPKKRPKLGAKTIRERDGNRCQFTCQLFKPEEGSLDHVLRYLLREDLINGRVKNHRLYFSSKLFLGLRIPGQNRWRMSLGGSRNRSNNAPELWPCLGAQTCTSCALLMSARLD